MSDSHPTYPRTAEYVALCLLNLMPERWEDARAPRARCRAALRGEPLASNGAPAAALAVLRDVAFPSGFPAVVVDWLPHLSRREWEGPRWKNDFWSWMLDSEARRWTSRLADYAGQFGRGRSAWWAYAELWVLELGIRFAVLELLPAAASPVRTLDQELHRRALVGVGAIKDMIPAGDSSWRKWTSGERHPRWDGIEDIEERFADTDRTWIARAAMLDRALARAEGQRVQALRTRFERSYAATKRWALSCPALQQFSNDEWLGTALVEAATEGSDSLAGFMIADFLAAKGDLADLKDDLLALRPGSWPSRILAKLGPDGPPSGSNAWSTNMQRVEELLTEAMLIALDQRPPIGAPRGGDGKTVEAHRCALDRPPANSEIRTRWEQALELCRKEISDYEISPGAQPHSFLPYAFGYSLMYGLDQTPRAAWRKTATTLGCDPKPPEAPEGQRTVWCPWLRVELLR